MGQREDQILDYLTRMVAMPDTSNMAKVMLVAGLVLGEAVTQIDIERDDYVRCINLLLALFRQTAADPYRCESIYPLPTPGDA